MALAHSELFSFIEKNNAPGKKTFFVASGKVAGDSNLFLEFSKHISSEFITFSDLVDTTLQPCDIVIFANIDNPSSFASFLSAQLPCQTILYTLYHPRAGIIELFLYKKLRLVLPRFVSTAVSLEYFYNLFKYLPYLDGLSILKILRHILHPLDVIASRFSFLCCASLEEAHSVSTFTSLSPEDILLQSHLPLHSPCHYSKATHSNPYFLTVGRAESRKNLLNLARIVPSFPNYEFIVVSSPSSSEPTIIKHLRLLSKSCPNLSLLEDLQAEQIYCLVAGSICVVNPSFFEVMSLIDITAISLSVPLITTRNSFIPSISSVYFHDPANRSSLSAAITAFLGQ